ncbi:hypothetical protein M8C13_28400 [Crossiella sp. SN42]|uniref:hypothetical protein n=1 Tax=Crossiella sp. SN42 TaxID=2944808 RepID=UPI00207C54CC|nr:hypothetical protein [Crossiella sp. SN42]MCO1579679.1 hypothetical protein [Crossiella sp. SN42]
MDEHKLADAFRDAVREVPPPSFNEQDVVTASHRASARQRKLVLSGSTFGVALLVGGTLVVTNLLGPGQTPNTASSGELTAEGSVFGVPPQDNSTGGQAGPGTDRAQPKTSSEPSKQGDGSASTGPSIGGTEGCGMADRELAAALAVELPAVAALTPEQAPAELCPQGSRGFALKTPEGTLTVSLGQDSGLSRDGGRADSGPGGAQSYTAITTHGAPLTIHSLPRKPGGKPPFAGELERLAKKLSDKY